jgi:DNA repair exonuclease SbcCD ATPase subunit
VQPLNLQLSNFGSFADVDVDLSEVTLAAVVGENGAGKSTLLTAISVALFGSAVGSLDGFVRQGAAGFRIVFVFDVNGQRYRATREHGKSQKATLERRGTVTAETRDPGYAPVCEPKVRDVDSAIVELLGCDFAGFSLAHLIPQDELGAFAKMDPASRKDWLLANLPMRQWSALESGAKLALADQQESLRDGEARIRALTEQMPDVSMLEDELLTLAATIEQRTAGIALTEKIVEAGTAAREERARLNAEVRATNAALIDASGRQGTANGAADVCEIRLSDLEKELATLPTEVPDIPALEAEVETARESMETLAEQERAYAAFVEQETRAQKIVREADIAVGVARKHLADFDAKKSPTCPVCGQEVKGASYDATRNALSVTYDMAQTSADAAAETLDSLRPPDVVPHADSLASARNEAHRASQRLTEARALAFQVAKRTTLEARIADTRVEFASLTEKSEAADMDVEKTEAAYKKTLAAVAAAPADDSAEAQESLRQLRASLDSANRDRGRIEASMATAAKMSAELASTEESLAGGRKRADLLALLVKAYGKGGIPGRMLEGAVAEIEAFANDFLGRFTDGMSLTLSTQRENKGGGVRETLDILVTDSLGTRPIESYSGGEKTRIFFALSVGLSRFLSAIGSGHVDMFVVDEPPYLSESGNAELIACLHIMAASVPFVLLVTHEDSLKDAFPQQITVKKGASGSAVTIRG